MTKKEDCITYAGMYEIVNTDIRFAWQVCRMGLAIFSHTEGQGRSRRGRRE